MNTYALTEKRPIDLTLSENPLGCSPLVSRAFTQLDSESSHYPTPHCGMLKVQLAERFGMSPSNFVVANGSDALIKEIPRVFGSVGDEVVIPQLTFPLFELCSHLAGKRVLRRAMTRDLGIDLVALEKMVTDKTSLVWICNPNNPTGSVLPKSSIMSFLDRLPSAITVVVDEATIEFGGNSIVDEVKSRDNLIILRTFSKGFGLASLRVGFAVAHPSLIHKIENALLSFPISAISEHLACVALRDSDFIARTKLFINRQRNLMTTQLKQMNFRVVPSDSNTLFVQIPKKCPPATFHEQLRVGGVSVVLGSSFAGFDDSFFRISIRDEETNRMFLDKVAEAIRAC